ncbi:TIGR03086 family protein [Kineosporia sp. J2-2]|uniref:TIGR03086 family protein n=1 Tax=Kineosporia corallincola TaxID=2835133 RepID=A0ABS5TE60_9ACTN|nr:TIGR03086 family metal-binding protein [Kineosporia corallincola]MBT0769362.1 TIGR03086 family protein [Kineosporia corallincola]
MTTPGEHLTTVLDQLADLIAQVQPEQYDAPTPCPEFDVADLRNHILGWADFFATALADPQGTERPAADAYLAAEAPGQAADDLRAVSRQVAAAVRGGVAQQQVTLFGAPMPGSATLGMCLGEYLVHGHDLAQATGLPWNPPAEAVSVTLAFMPSMLTDEFRGPDKSFGHPVEVPASASDLDRLVAFTGRDPGWKAGSAS